MYRRAKKKPKRFPWWKLHDFLDTCLAIALILFVLFGVGSCIFRPNALHIY